MNFARNERVLQQVSDELSAIVGRRLRVHLENPSTESRDTAAASSAASPRSPAALERRAAMDLPLVREAFAVFPDATLIDAREEAAAALNDPDESDDDADDAPAPPHEPTADEPPHLDDPEDLF